LIEIGERPKEFQCAGDGKERNQSPYGKTAHAREVQQKGKDREKTLSYLKQEWVGPG